MWMFFCCCVNSWLKATHFFTSLILFLFPLYNMFHINLYDTVVSLQNKYTNKNNNNYKNGENDTSVQLLQKLMQMIFTQITFW